MTTLEYYGHSCFRLTAENGYRIVFDPYGRGSVPGIELPVGIEAEKVICSHEHADHNAADLISIQKNDISCPCPCPWDITQITVPHDHHNGTKRGMNQITILQNEEYKIVHFGDLGRLLNNEETTKLMNADVIMIPCGGYFTINAQEAYETIRQIQPHTTVLMHYHSKIGGYDVTADISEIRKVIPETMILPDHSISFPSQSGIMTLTPIQK